MSSLNDYNVAKFFYSQFVLEAHRQLKLSYTNAIEYLQAQHVSLQ